MENFGSYLNILITGICLCVGYIIKSFNNKKLNQYIPTISATLGLALAIATNLDHFTLETIFSGLFSGLASTGLYESFKNLIKSGGK